MWFGDKELSKFSPLRLTYWLFYAENAISIAINLSNQTSVLKRGFLIPESPAMPIYSVKLPPCYRAKPCGLPSPA